jgi:uncharacterized protein (DUF1330 family)
MPAVVIRFADKAAVAAWYRSEEYQAVVGIRHANSTGAMVIAGGIEPPAG